MSAALGPGKFYGSSLPRPRIYTDVKLNEERVDPPVPVLDPFLSWAEEAHWSKGGLSTKRHRHQGRIEGSIKNLRAEPDNFPNKRKQSDGDQIDQNPIEDSSPCGIINSATLSTPPAPVAIKRRRRFVGLVDDDEERESEGGDERTGNGSQDCVGSRNGRFPVRKLWDDFNSVVAEGGKIGRTPVKSFNGGSVAVATRTLGRRTSSRLAKPRPS